MCNHKELSSNIKHASCFTKKHKIGTVDFHSRLVPLGEAKHPSLALNVRSVLPLLMKSLESPIQDNTVEPAVLLTLSKTSFTC